MFEFMEIEESDETDDELTNICIDNWKFNNFPQQLKI